MVGVEGEVEVNGGRGGGASDGGVDSRMWRLSMPIRRWKAVRSNSVVYVSGPEGFGACWEPGPRVRTVAETFPEVLDSFILVARLWGKSGCKLD